MQLKRDFTRQFFTFILGGVLNTSLTYLLYIFLLNYLSYQLSYTLAYIAGIIISYFLNTFFVFKQRASLVKFFFFPSIYLLQYCVGIFLLMLLVQQLNFSPKLAVIIIPFVCLPLTFICSRVLLFKR